MYFDIHAVNPYIRVAMQSILRAGSEIKRRVIFDYELIYIESGEFILNYNECDYKCLPGQFILLRPGVPHSFRGIEKELSQPHIHFDIFYSRESPQIPISFKDISEFTPEERKVIRQDVFADYPQVPFVQFSDKQKVLELFCDIVRGADASQLTRKAKLAQIIDILVTDNFPNCFSAEESHCNVIQQLKDYIDAGQGITASLSDLEKQFSYSKYYLERQFKKSYGISLMAYRNNKRMQTAKEMLRTERVSVVAEALGFTSIYVFSRAFKQHFGFSPSKAAKKAFESK